MLGNRAYAIGFSHCAFYECYICVDCPYNLEDAGEMVSFSQCSLFNSYCCIANMLGAGLTFSSCSLDYAERVIWDNNGPINLVGCHVEVAPPTAAPFHNNHGRINVFGGVLMVSRGNRPPTTARAMFAFNNPHASVHLFAVQAWDWRTTSGKLAEGPGKIYWYRGAEITEAPPEVGRP